MRLFATLCTGLITLSAFGRIVPKKDPLDGVLEAQLVVIVRQAQVEASKLFKVEEVFLGDAKKGDFLDLGNFRLSIVLQYGDPTLVAITPETRILVFLHRSKDFPRWEPTYFQESVFWVQRPEDAALLRRAAERAVDLRRRWKLAASMVDREQRVKALWPFLDMGKYGVRFFERTRAELERSAPEAGEYFSEQFDEMSHDDRMQLLPGAGAFGSKKLQQKLRLHLEHEQTVYENFVTFSGKLPRNVDWNTLPGSVKDASGELYYGLSGLARFGDRDDLPFIRNIALWAAKFHLEQTEASALNAFRNMPTKENIPVIITILDEFLPLRKPGLWSIDWDAESALCNHKYPESVPALALFLGEHSSLAEEAQGCLQQIVGRDLGRDPQPWKDWYANNSRHSSVP